ncbi:putative DNA-binding protein with PD1-like motif [Phyllobacterium myrsinacearum]|uniref:Putative DNA-binding protein with PD1-like motif n=1 Tax=Phyllobacterium myrsinacearum TaxID=28101 RepID=A0A839EKU4_9HYPH|nr:putative DNA-binding protein with PD1-like motif [Phyllobacterium myrsinacearum]
MPDRRLQQPGPAAVERFESFLGTGRTFSFDLQPGLSINDAIAIPLAAANLRAAALVIEGGAFAPFHYLMPAPSADGLHAAWYSDTFSPAGETLMERGNVTFGERDGAPFIHCHATWIEPDGRRCAGHILPHETIVSQPIRATAWGVESVRMVSEPDTETAFTIFHPVPVADQPSAFAGPQTIIARVRPNEDITGALEAICRKHGFTGAHLRGGVGSLIGARYVDGSRVDDIATEVFITGGFVSADSSATCVEIVMVDTRGGISHGNLLRGDNPVCITFELCLEEA